MLYTGALVREMYGKNLGGLAYRLGFVVDVVSVAEEPMYVCEERADHRSCEKASEWARCGEVEGGRVRA